MAEMMPVRRYQYFEYWKWADEEDPNWQPMVDEWVPRGAELIAEAVCDKCGRIAQLLFFDPRLGLEDEMKEAGQKRIRAYRDWVTKKQDPCESHPMPPWPEI